MTDLTVFREYEPHECGDDGYPYVWHRNTGAPPSGALDGVIRAALDAGGEGFDFRCGVKHLVRAEQDHRCQRCHHPFVVGVSGDYERGGIGRDARTDQLMLEQHLDPEIAQVERVRRINALGTIEAPGTNWSPCDEHCTHQGPFRFRYGAGEWTLVPEPPRGELTLGPDGYLHLMNGATVQAAWRILTVHHLNGRKHDLRWWNLAALCQRCHLLIQRKVIIERIFPFEHTDWFKPHAAGWYAYIYEGRNITRDEAIERQDELLALERMA